MASSRMDLLDLLATIPQVLREKKFADEPWNILGIVKHIGSTEWWYLDRLGLTDLTGYQLQKDSFERQELIQNQVNQA